MKWAKEVVDAFNVLLARQLSSTERDGAVWKQCMERAKIHAEMLSEVQLDFGDLVGREPQGAKANGPVGLGLA